MGEVALTSTVVEAHADEEQARGVNLDSGCAGGMDLDGGHTGGVDLNGGGGWRGADVEAVDAARRRSGR
jgi:hypothetical protein